MDKKFRQLVFLIAIASSALFHLANHSYLQKDSPEALRKGVTVMTNDDASYLAPVENFLDGKGWRSNLIGKAAYTTRSPGYGFIYLVFRYSLSEKDALLALVVFQVLLFSFAITLVPDILGALYLNKKWKQVLTLSFACLPMFFGFLSYTLTEAVTPSLVLIILALASPTNRTLKQDFLLWLVLALLILIRPAMIVWVFSLPILYSAFHKKTAMRLSIAMVVVLTPTILWQIHLYRVTGEVQGLHPIYQDDSNTIYRSPHKAVWNFHKSWGQTGEAFHRNIGFLASAARYNRNKKYAISKVLQQVPTRVKSTVSEDSLRVYYGLYYDILQSQKDYFREEKPIPGVSADEQKLIRFFNHVRDEYASSDFFYSQVIVPAQVFRRLALHSNLSLYIFQKPWRGNLFMETLRMLCFANHVLGFYIFLLSLFILFPSRKALVIILPTMLYLGYLCVIQRGVEERYTLPFLIPMIAVSAKTLELIYRRSVHLIKGQ